jgi:hypothetical protein
MIRHAKILKTSFITIDGLLKFRGYSIFEVTSVCFRPSIDHECGFMRTHPCTAPKHLHINPMRLMDYNACLSSISGGFMSPWGDWVVLSRYVVYQRIWWRKKVIQSSKII